jgi:hypothetical protein
VAGRRSRIYRADRVAPDRWVLSVDGDPESEHRSYRAAVQAARAFERRVRTKSTIVRNSVVLVAALAALVLVVDFRLVSNPDHEEARTFVDRMESAYRSAESGVLDVADLEAEAGGLAGAAYALEVGTQGELLVRVIVGEFLDDCYLIRWDSGDPPFVAVLSPRLACQPGSHTLNLSPSAYERIAVQLFPDRPIEWDPVLPSAMNLALWFFPAVFVLGFVMLRALVSLSIVAIQRGVPVPQVPVERTERALQEQSDSINGNGSLR